MSPDRELFTVNEMARRTGIAARYIRRAIHAGHLPAYTPSGKWVRLFPADVMAWVRASRVRPTTHARIRVAEILEREQSRPP